MNRRSTTRRPSASASSKVRRIPELHNLEVMDARIDGFQFPQHFHDTFVLEWVTSGADHCCTSGAVARRGQLFVHGPRVPHAGSPGAGAPLAYRACYPSLELAGEVLGTGSDELPRVGTLVIESPAIEREATRLFATLERGRDHAAVRSALREVLLRVFEAGEGEPAVTPAVPAGIRRAQRHLIAHLARDVSIDELSGVSDLSPYHMIREFKRALHLTPRQFLISQRVTRARDLLAAGHPIADVAFATGFADQSHLSRHVKRITGLSPGQLRGA